MSKTSLLLIDYFYAPHLEIITLAFEGHLRLLSHRQLTCSIAVLFDSKSRFRGGDRDHDGDEVINSLTLDLILIFLSFTALFIQHVMAKP